MASLRPEVEVTNGDWGGVGLSALRAVLQPAAQILCDAFGRVPEAPVHVYPGSGSPQVAWDRRPYRVRLTARDTYWSQHVYQFSHELCHVLANFDRVREHPHKWFEESLCELASLFVLHRLSGRFRRRPPPEVLEAESYAPHFAGYADQVVERVAGPSRADLPAWVAASLPELEADRYLRHLNRVVAAALLDDFLADDSLWRDCGLLNRWDAGSDASFAAHLESWTRCSSRRGGAGRTPRLVRRLLFEAPGSTRAPSVPGTGGWS